MPTYTYVSDDGDNKPIRLAAATATAGSFSQGATDDADFVKVSKGNREFGQRPRGLTLSRNLGSDDEPNLRYKFLPMATQAAFNAASIGSTITVGGVSWTVIGKRAEDN